MVQGLTTVEPKQIVQRADQLKAKYSTRDANMRIVDMVREGRMHDVAGMGQYFSDELPRGLVANTVKVAAEDLRDVMAPLPSLACSTKGGISAAAKKRAETKNRIGQHYWDKSRLETKMFTFADSFNTYGFAVLVAEPDFIHKRPVIRVEEAKHFYYYRDRDGNTSEVAKIWSQPADQLAAMFPEHRERILMSARGGAAAQLDVIRYSHYEHGTYLILPSCDALVLSHLPNLVKGKLPYFVVERPGLSSEPLGQFDETVWIQYAQTLMGQYMFRAAEESINASLILPRDVSDVAPVMFSDNVRPGHGKIPLNIPTQLFTYNQQLEQEVKDSAKYPDARTGGIKASIITGRGTEALLGGFDTQIKTAQMLFKQTLEDVTSYCFELDCHFWYNVKRTITGISSGQSYSLDYIPSRDIGEDYDCQVSYGFSLGNSPAQAMMLLLQLQTADLVSKHTVQEKLPFDIDRDQESRLIKQQRLDESMMSGVAAYAQALGLMIQQGQDPMQILQPLVKLAQLNERGKPFHEAVAEAFTPPEPEPTPEMPAAPEGGEPAPGAEGEIPPNMAPSGLLKGVPAGGAGRPPGGMPDVMNLIGGLRGGGEPQMGATVLRRRAV